MKTIFVVDDAVSSRRPMERLLQAEGYETRGVNNGLEALEALQTVKPDLILLDLAMPVMDGFELLGLLHETPRLADVPVIVVSGESSAESLAQVRDLGARDVFFKTRFTVDDLFASIRRQVDA